MSANLFGNRFYGNRSGAWHNLGFTSQEDHTAQESLAILGSYWIEKRPVTIFLNGENQETGDFALVRSPVPDESKERVFGFTAKGYNILQPDEICDIFDNSLPNTPVETLGMLGHGEKLFLTWKMPEISINGDAVKTFGFVASGFDGLFGTSLSLVTTRVVCENTFNAAIHESESTKTEGRGRVFTAKHNSLNLGRDLGIWMEHIQEKALAKTHELETAFIKMDNTSLDNTEDLANLLFQIYPDPKQLGSDYPSRLRAEKEEKINDAMEKASNDRSLVEKLFSGEGTAINATAWGLFNSITEYENWGRSTKKPAEYSILLGGRSQQMMKAYNTINNWVDQK